MSARPKVKCFTCNNLVTLRKAREVVPGMYECKGHMDERMRNGQGRHGAQREAERRAFVLARGKRDLMKRGITVPAETMRQIKTHLSRDRIIHAIKALRNVTGLGLKESKDFIDAMRNKTMTFPTKYDAEFDSDKPRRRTSRVKFRTS